MTDSLLLIFIFVLVALCVHVSVFFVLVTVCMCCIGLMFYLCSSIKEQPLPNSSYEDKNQNQAIITDCDAFQLSNNC